jgi:hypothetical protein
MKSSFNQVILTNMLLDLVLATACLRSADRRRNRRRAHNGGTAVVRAPQFTTGSSESTISTKRAE